MLTSVLGEISICIAYLALNPPRVYKNMESQNIKIILECNEGSVEFLCSIFGMDVFLALLYFLKPLWHASCHRIITKKENASPLECWVFFYHLDLFCPCLLEHQRQV